MSAKSVIQNLQDSQLIRIFLDFVQTFHLQYQKIDKQISYKCHEATWILATTKATGYGRTQSQAYKHALRNLLEILIQDPPYTQFFVNLLSSVNSSHSGSSNIPVNQVNYSTFNQNPQGSNIKINKSQQSQQPQNKSKLIPNKPPLQSNLSASLTTNNNSYGNVNNKRQLKTQGIQNQHQHQHQNQNQDQCEYKQPNILTNNNKHRQKQRYDINKSSANSIYTTSYKCTPTFNHQYSGSQSSNPNTTNSKKQYMKGSSNSPISYYNNNININESLAQLAEHEPKIKTTTHTPYQYHHQNNSSYEEDMKAALARNRQLLHQLNLINKQNQVLKSQIYSIGGNGGGSMSNMGNTNSSKNIMISSLGGHTYNNINNSATKGMRLSTGSSHNTNTYSNTNPSAAKIYPVSNTTSSIMKDITSMSANILQNLNKNSNKNNNMELDDDLHAGVGTSPNTNTNNNTNKNVNVCSQSYSAINVLNSQDSIKGRPSLNSNPSNASTINPNKSKILVPKLKLQILPNYHKKAQKSLNDSLLAVYEQKHGTTHNTNVNTNANANTSTSTSTNITHNSNNASLSGGFHEIAGQGQTHGVMGIMNFNVSVNSIKKIA